jgi:hypothetical protein
MTKGVFVAILQEEGLTRLLVLGWALARGRR